MKQTFKTGLAVIIFGMFPLIIYSFGLEIGIFEPGFGLLFGILFWFAVPTAVIILIVGVIQYLKIKSKHIDNKR